MHNAITTTPNHPLLLVRVFLLSVVKCIFTFALWLYLQNNVFSICLNWLLDNPGCLKFDGRLLCSHSPTMPIALLPKLALIRLTRSVQRSLLLRTSFELFSDLHFSVKIVVAVWRHSYGIIRTCCFCGVLVSRTKPWTRSLPRLATWWSTTFWCRSWVVCHATPTLDTLKFFTFFRYDCRPINAKHSLALTDDTRNFVPRLLLCKVYWPTMIITSLYTALISI